MHRRHSATNAMKFTAKAPPRSSTAGARRPVLPDAPKDEGAYYAARLNELEAEYTKMQRDYQQQLAANRRAIRRLHDENTHLRSIAVSHSVSGDITATELEHLETRKFLDIRRLNRLSHQLEKLQQDIALDEEARRLHEEAAHASKAEAITGNRSVALRIQKLEKRLDALLAEHQCAHSVKNGYAAVLTQMQRESDGHESRLLAMEKDIDARRQDYSHLCVMYNNAVSDYQRALEALRQFNEDFQKTRAMKEKALAGQRTRVDRLLRDTQRLEQRDVELQQDIEDEQQRLGEAELEQQAMRRRQQRTRSVTERLAAAGTNSSALADTTANAFFGETYGGAPEDEERAAAYDESFRRMMRAAGAQTLDALVQHFEGEYAMRMQMRRQMRAAEERRDALREALREGRAAAARRRLCGSGGAPFATRALRDELRVFCAEADVRRDAAREESARTQWTLAEAARRVDVLDRRSAAGQPDALRRLTQQQQKQQQHGGLVTRLSALARRVMVLAKEAVGGAPNGVPAAASVRVHLTPGNTRVRLPAHPAHPVSPTSASAGAMGGRERAATPPGEPSTGSNDAQSGLLHGMDGEASCQSSASSSTGEESVTAAAAERTVGLAEPDEPLNREQIKRLAAQVVRREARRRQRDEGRS